jgi:ABC-2 type transport system ATP-binding protein
VNGSPDAISISHLSKRFGTFTAVDDLSLNVRSGEFFGLLGPNGAGKTTTINAIVGLARPTAGRVAVFGADTQNDWRNARGLVGLAPQEYNFDRYLSIREVLIYQAGYFGLQGAAVKRRADALLERFGLAEKANETYVKLSGGMKRRLTLARALIHEPRLLILDEPTAGVDIELRIELWSFLRELNAGGMTIVLTTHYLEEAEALCRTIGIIEGGRLVAFDTTERLLSGRGGSTLRVTLDREFVRCSSLELDRLAARPDDDAPGVVRFERLEADRISTALAALERAGYRIVDIDYRRANLQDVFLELTRR